ncbi:MAG: N,N'-diacetyllegionaminic acid synthase [Candidatus Sericytochromatia bacterium]|nr:MAG: N,N'-diacetyllegionaminic acid synthase [Candidatus Sericytochromatia bacterium]
MISRTFIIAEAGVNHNGKIELAERLIDIAKDCGADAVKFQTFKTENVVSRSLSKADYQIRNTNTKNETQFEMLKKLELSYEQFKHLYKYSKKRNIIFLSTPFDIESSRYLKELGMEIFKIPSGEITNYLLLKEIGSYNKRVILSTGISDLKEIKNAIDVLVRFGTNKENISILHCNTDYPTSYQDVNLKAMITIKNEFGLEVGYSDHTLGIEVSIAAVALGAKIIEKHFTIDKNLDGPDHKCSLEPAEMKEMIKCIRNIELALGNGIKKVSESALKNLYIVRKSIVAKAKIKKGDVFTEENLTVKRAGKGISPMEWENIIGKISNKDYQEDDLIEYD